MQKLFLLFALMLIANSLHAQTTSTKIRDTIVIKEKFDYLYANENGKIMAVLVNPDGSTTESEVDFYKSPNQCLVTDGKGDSLVIDNNGRPMGISEYRATGGNKALLNEYHRKKDSAAVWYVNFKPYPKQEYSFDYLGSSDHGIFATDEYYPKSGNYDFRYKSVATSTTDRVIVDFGFYPEKDSVIFKDKYGVKLKLSKDNILTFTSTSTADTNYIFAYRGEQRIGKLVVKTYAKKAINLTLVKVNNSTCPKISEIEKYLNKVYKCANVEFKVSAQEFSIPELKTFNHGGSKWTSVYNDDQKKVLEAYDSQMQEGNYYLFFIDNVTNKYDSLGTAVAGYMPRGYNAGFIYDGGSPRTIAHEIGHGAFALEHAFRNSSNSGKTKNLMDYSTGEELWHFQWDNCQDPKRVWMKWKKDESEAENQFVDDYVCTMKFINYFCEAYHNKTKLVYLKDKIPYLGHSAKFFWTEENREIHFKICVKKDINTIPTTTDLTQLTDIFEITRYDKVDSQDFIDYLVNDYHNRKNALLENEDNVENRGIIRNLSMLPENTLEELPILDRYMMLDIISRDHLTEDYCSCENDEMVAINLIKTTPKDDIKTLLEKIFYPGNVFKNLSSHIDGDNYFRFLNEVTNKWLTINLKKISQAKNDGSNANYLYWNRSNNNRSYITYDTEYENGKIDLKWWYGDRTDVVMYENLGWGSYAVYHYLTINPLDVVMLHCKTVPECFFENVKPDQVLMMPAFLFYAMNEQFLWDRNVDYIETGFTIASLIFTVGEIAALKSTEWAAKNLYKKAWVFIDGIFAVGNTIFTNSAAKNFVDKNCEDLKIWFDVISKILDIKSVKSIDDILELESAFKAFNAGWAGYQEQWILDHKVFNDEEKKIISDVENILLEISKNID